MTNPQFNWLFETEPEDNVNGRRIPIPRGKSLGGSSSINGMIFVRGQPLDYDTWVTVRQPRLVVRSRAAVLSQDGALRARGQWPGRRLQGHRRVTQCLGIAFVRHELADAFIDAGEALGHPRNPDYNNGTQDGVGYYQVTMRNGQRWSAAHAYLEPARNRANLHIQTGAHSKHVVLDGKRATGVAYSTSADKTREAKAGEVILAAGGVQSPQLLELSRHRPARSTCNRSGSRSNIALPGVGENYRDHICARLNWRVTNTVSFNEQTRGWRLMRRRHCATSPPGTACSRRSAALAHAFVRSRPELAITRCADVLHAGQLLGCQQACRDGSRAGHDVVGVPAAP